VLGGFQVIFDSSRNHIFNSSAKVPLEVKLLLYGIKQMSLLTKDY